MNILSTCLGCGACVSYCPQEAIHLQHGKATIDPTRCVECLICMDIEVCPCNALQKGEDENSIIKQRYGQMIDSRHAGEKKRTVDICDVKKCDVVSFPFPENSVMLEIEAGRPYGGVTLGQLNILRQELLNHGYSCNMRGRHKAFLDPATNMFPQEKSDLRILYLAQQTAVPIRELPSVITLIEDWATRQNVCVSLNATLPAHLEQETRQVLVSCRHPAADRMKANLGWGKTTELAK